MAEPSPPFDELHAQYRTRILHYLSGMVGEAEAEELTQETFLKVAKALPGFRGESKVSTWLYRIATNVARDRLRTLGHQTAASVVPLKEEAPEEGTDVEDRNVWTGESAPGMAEQTARKQMNSCVRSVIDELPEDYRTVIVMSDIEGFKDKEIAEILGVSYGAAKIKLHRARAKLKTALEQSCTYQRDERNEFTCEPLVTDPDRLTRIRPKE